jgi:hypothetical protein
MTTSGAYNFGITTQSDSIIEEAYDRCGKDPSELSAYDTQKAIRSLNFLFSDWSNKQCNLWTVQLQTLNLEAGREMYTLDNSTLAMLQTATRITLNDVAVDIIVTGISRSDYLSLPNKIQTAQRPTSFYFQRSVPPLLYVWPVPDNDDVKLIYYRIRAMQDFVGMKGGQDAPQRWMDAIAAGLAYRLSVKGAGGDTAGLKNDADAAFAAAAAEDRERVPLNVVPDITLGRW